MTSMDIDSPTTPSMAITPVFPTDNNEAPISEEQPNKRRRKKSIVWEHFTIETVGAGCMRACCKQCKKSFAYITGSKLAGTSHLKRHIALGICPVSRQKNEALQQSTPGAKTDPPKRRYRTSPVFGGIPFDQDRCNQEVAKMIIQHEYPLHIVEHPAFIDFVRTLQPQYSMMSFNTIQGECVALYLREKQSLLSLINGIPGRVSLTLDLGTSNLNIGYAFLTGHFIDDDWNLHHRVLNVVMLPFPDSDYAFNQAVVSCLSDWHLENRLFTLTLDQSFSNETIIGNLRGLLSTRNPHKFNGQLLRGNCYARVLSRLAQDSLGAMRDVIRRIRESVKYVKTSETHEEKFAELRQRLQVPSTKELTIDDQTKWNTTYQMLLAACELKEVFACLDTTDPVYKINPSMDDWKQVEILCTYLKLLYDAASILTAPSCPPANAFYHEVSKVQLELSHAAMSQDPFVSNLTRPLTEKFDQYWKDCFLVLAIAVVMDPRFKMKLVEFSFSRIFGEDAGMWIKIVDDGIHELFLEYLAPNLSVPTSYMEAEHANISHSDIFQEMPPPQEARFEEAPLQEVHPAHGAPQEATQGATFEVVHPKKEPPEDAFPQVMHNEEAAQHEMLIQEDMVTHEVPMQEIHTEEVPLQEVSTEEVRMQEINTEEVPQKKMHNQEVPLQETNIPEVSPQEMQTQEESAQERQTQEESAQEMQTQEESAQEMQTQEESAQEMQTQEESTQEMQTQEVLTQDIHAQEEPIQEIQAQAEPTQEVQAQEEPKQEIQAQDEATQEMHVQDVLRTEEMHAQDVVRTEEMHAQDVVRIEEMHAQEVVTEEIHLQGQSKEFHPQGGQSEEMQPQEHTVEVHPQGGQTEEMHSQEQTEEMHSREQNEDVHSRGQTKEMQHQAETEEIQPQGQTEEIQPEGQSEEKQRQGQTEEIVSQGQTEEVQSQGQTEEVQSQGQTEEVQSQGQTEEIQPQEMCLPEGQACDMHPAEAQAQEMHPSEAQNHVMLTPEEQTQEMLRTEAQTQEMHHTEAQTQEMHPTDVQTQETQEMHLTEAQTQEMHPTDVQTQEMHLTEAQTQEMHPTDVQTQEMHPTEGQTQEMHPTEFQTQEIHHPEVQTEEMHSQEAHALEVHSQEAGTLGMQPHEAESQEMHLQEVQIHETYHPQEAESQGMHLQEVHIHETYHQEISSQEMHSQEVQIHEAHHQEISRQEMHTQVLQTHEMHYQSFSEEMQSHEVHTQDLPLLTIGDGLSDFEVYISEISNSQHLKSELDQYLEESLLPRVQEFDVLGWWKLNKLKYPILSKMAADILSIPVSTVAPDSVFDTGSKKIDGYRSSLRPVTLEALVCAKDWLQYGSSGSSSEMSNALVKMEF